MATSVKGVAKRLLFSLTVLASLGGCAVYDAGYGGYDTYAGVSGYDYYGGAAYPVAPVYGYRPAPFYPAPVYVPPPVLQFNYRSGGHWRHDGGAESIILATGATGATTVRRAAGFAAVGQAAGMASIDRAGRR